MTVPVPAGAGGVDREALVLRRAFAADRSDDMAKVYVQDVGDLLAALAAAEQRADTLAADVERVRDLVMVSGYWHVYDTRDAGLCYDAGFVDEWLADVRAALSSRPVQPEGEQR